MLKGGQLKLKKGKRNAKEKEEATLPELDLTNETFTLLLLKFC